MDRIKDKMAKIREEHAQALHRAEAMESKNAANEQKIAELEARQDDLQKKFDLESDQLSAVEEELKEHKGQQMGGGESTREGEALKRKVAALEKTLAAVNVKFADADGKLNATETKADTLEAQLTQSETARDEAERKYEEAQAKFQASKLELDELVRSMEGM